MIADEQALRELMGRVNAAQQELEQAQSDVAVIEVTGTAGSGLVTVTMNGSCELTSVNFAQSVIDEGDAEALASLTLAAMRRAADEIRRVTAERMAMFTPGVDGTWGDYLRGTP